ncbi:VOC family protein [Nocardioides dubius]|uniref:VOC domain-containing protein n=1 Tax=Nocardioides dubius TaxID=317019 RepID=A0ABN1TVF9_9ACTN
MRLTRPGLDLGIVVRDVERSLTFYRDLLGLPVRGDMQVPGVGRLLLLDVGHSTLKLVQLDRGIDIEPEPGGLRAGAAGMRYCTFSISDLDEVVTTCREAGFRIGMRPTTMGPGVRVAAVEDPDQNWIELMETNR